MTKESFRICTTLPSAERESKPFLAAQFQMAIIIKIGIDKSSITIRRIIHKIPRRKSGIHISLLHFLPLVETLLFSPHRSSPWAVRHSIMLFGKMINVA